MQDNATMQEATGFTFRTILDFFGVGDITGIEILLRGLAWSVVCSSSSTSSS